MADQSMYPHRFQQGNQLWKLAPPQRGRKFDPYEIWVKAQEYFDWCIKNPIMVPEVGGKDAKIVYVPRMNAPTLRGLIAFIPMNHDTWYSYAKLDEYSDIISHITNLIFSGNVSAALAGAINPNLVSKLEGLVDKKEVKTEDSVQIILMTPDNGRQIESETKDLEEGSDFKLL